MFEISVETSFTATHAVTVCGIDEEPHCHDWTVVVTVHGNSLDNDGLLLDFHKLQQELDKIVSQLCNSNLNTCSALNGHNPTAERLAWYIAKQMQVELPVSISSVTVTEAPFCKATYRP
ncbi:6-carboxytetrahydropterin synthase [PVC group bacterium]|nr:6-carboxytetrahydropterin synthase [PVC group bacterium]